MKEVILMIAVVGSTTLLLIVPVHIQLWESEMTTEAWLNYNDDPELSKPGYNYNEPARRIVYRGWIPYTDPEVHSYVIAEKDSIESYYTVITDMDTMEYEILYG